MNLTTRDLLFRGMRLLAAVVTLWLVAMQPTMAAIAPMQPPPGAKSPQPQGTLDAPVPGGGAPQPSLTRAPSPIVGFGAMALLMAVVIAISFMPSKRSHQD